MLVRCLAMMRGGGETRHLAWARELIALGVNVDIIAGRPLLFGGPRYPIDRAAGHAAALAVHARLRLSPSASPRVRPPDDDGAACGRRVVLPGGVATHRRGPDKPDIVHAHALHQAARLRLGDIPVVVNLPGEPNRAIPRRSASSRRARRRRVGGDATACEARSID